MINVIASIKVKAGQRDAFLAAFKANIPAVLAEDGCIEYYPTVDADSGLPPQVKDADTVTIIEKWASVAALQAHAKAPHMLAYREKVKDIVVGMSLKVLQQA
ncbi:MAG: antibiotic biosynthesis monooxygenase [Ectothiorhodospiraceae bacterium]|nr:antibiotic biosynthesis monooxygenase [Chromatiales bacterium]MCP5156510.1 antibiotic biosynthesis monooxygenase [Ectothiorhodospiraceae bacterium]